MKGPEHPPTDEAGINKSAEITSAGGEDSWPPPPGSGVCSTCGLLPQFCPCPNCQDCGSNCPRCGT